MATTSWRNRKTLILSRTDMMGLLTPTEYVDCVEMAFRRQRGRQLDRGLSPGAACASGSHR